MTLALNEIIIRANYETALARAKLETEESGRVVASLQGHISGYKALTAFLAAEFHLTEGFIQNSGDSPNNAPDMDDAWLAVMDSDIRMLKEDPAWQAVLARIDNNTEHIKNHLLLRAEKSRELDIGQGQYRATTFYNSFFESIENEICRRKAAEEKKRQEPELPFDEDQEEPVASFDDEQDESVDADTESALDDQTDDSGSEPSNVLHFQQPSETPAEAVQQ